MNNTKDTGNGSRAAPATVSRDPNNPEHYLFDGWHFNADTDDLSDGETSTRLEPQVAKLLEYFLNHQHKVISRDELIAAVWENRHVSDDAINRCVSILRQILSPDDKHAYIETVVRKGYIAHFPPPSVVEPDVTQPRSRRKYLLLAAVFAGLLAITLYMVGGKLDDPTPDVSLISRTDPPMVAVLPFTSVGHGSDGKLFSDGVHNDLLTQLSKLQSMRVISSTSVMEYRDASRNLRKIGEELGADVILEGSVQIAADRIRINAQLIDAASDEHLWAESYDRELSPANIFDVQSEIAGTIALQLHTTLTERDKAQLRLIPTENMAAYRAYHRAMRMSDSQGIGMGGPDYLEALEEAVALDPNFSRAWAELVSTLAIENFSNDKPEMTLRAEQALQRLQAVAPGSADLLFGQAAYVYYTLKDYDRAHGLISRALEMAPSNVRAVQLKSWIERRQNDFDAVLNSKWDAYNLDPRNAVRAASLVNTMLVMHRYDDAEAFVETSTLESFQTSSTRNLLLFREHRDFNRLREAEQELCSFYDINECGWSAHIAARDYSKAWNVLEPKNNEVKGTPLGDSDRRQIFTLWLMGDDERLAQGLPQWQEQLDADRNDAGEFFRPQSYIGLALLMGIQGNVNEARRLIERWPRHEYFDGAERTVFRHETCRVLGMIGATQAAVECIRKGLEEPSYVLPFFEPYLPFYDAVRNEPAFIEMLTDIDGAGA